MDSFNSPPFVWREGQSLDVESESSQSKVIDSNIVLVIQSFVLEESADSMHGDCIAMETIVLF